MKPITIEGMNRLFELPGCFDLPAHNDGMRTATCWELDDEDMELLLKTRRIYMTIYTGPQVPPMGLQLDNPIYNSPDAFRSILYSHVITDHQIRVWNACDYDAPLELIKGTATYRRMQNAHTPIAHIVDLKIGQHFTIKSPVSDDYWLAVKLEGEDKFEEYLQPKKSTIIDLTK